MYILQNAAKNLFRNKGRNILMGVIILAIIATSAVALIINNTANGIIDDYKERFGAEVRITPDMERIREEATRNMGGGMMGGGGANLRSMMASAQIPPEQYILFSQSQYLRETMFTATVGVHNSDDIAPIDEELGGVSDMMGNMADRMGGMGGMLGRFSGSDVNEIEQPDEELMNLFSFYANLMGYNFIPDDFVEGTRQLADGRFPEADGEAIISRDLLMNSGLSIGDTINLTSVLRETNPDPDIPREEQEIYEISYTLTIVGYYDDITPEYSNNFMQNAFFNRRNEIITTADTVIAGMREGFTGIRVSATYYLRNPDMLAAFEAEVRANGIDDIFLVSTDEAGYNTIVQPVEGLRSVTFTFLIVVLILGAVILILLSSLAVRERKYEIGVLRAMGMKKGKVAFGMLFEMVIITLVCLVVGLGIGVMAAQPVSDMLLESQLQNIEPAQDNSPMGQFGGRMGGMGGMMGRMGGMFGGVSGTQAEALQEMDVSMSTTSIIQIILVSLMLAVVSSIVGIAHVTKYEPIKILSNRT